MYIDEYVILDEKLLHIDYSSTEWSTQKVCVVHPDPDQ